MHKLQSEQIKASAQAKYMDEIMSILTEEEIAVFKRARNTHMNVDASFVRTINCCTLSPTNAKTNGFNDNISFSVARKTYKVSLLKLLKMADTKKDRYF